MFDISSPKVLTPAILFALLSPGILLSVPAHAGLMTQAITHALVLMLVYFIVAKYLLKTPLTTADLVVPALLFVLLTPGILVSATPQLLSAVAVHAIVFSVVFAIMRGTFSQYY